MVTFYQHLSALAKDWQKGEPVAAGEVLGDMGYAPGDPEGLRHLHFEIWFPKTGVPQDTWRIDPAPYMKTWKRATLPALVA
jgi:murein DD-endopeptidase MepM/ murein hydrolase activator NlpD